jgi:hypothetical protein
MHPGSPTPAIRPRSSLTACEGCRHFQRDHINPEAGMGRCLIGLGMWHPGMLHVCRKREEAA